MMEVIYESWFLGLGGEYKEMRTGIFNFAHQLLCALALEEECQLYLSAHRLLPMTLSFLKKYPLPGTVILPPDYEEQSLGDHLEHALFHLKNLNKRTKGLKSYIYVLEKLYALVERRLNKKDISLKGIDPHILRKAKIYHYTDLGEIPPFIRKYPVRCIQTIFDLIPLLQPELVSDSCAPKLYAALKDLRFDDIVITDSGFVKKQIVDLFCFPEEQIFIIHPGTAPEFTPCRDEAQLASIRALYGIGDSPYFIAVGRHDKRKNYLRLINAFLALRQQNPDFDVKLVIVGPNSNGTLEITPFLTSPYIIHTGFISNEDLALLYNGALAFIQPSLTEGFGIPIVEAMKCEIPVICSNTSSMPEVAGDAALYIDPLSEKSIFDALYAVYTNKSLRETLLCKGKERATKFSWERAAKETLEVYRYAISTSRRR